MRRSRCAASDIGTGTYTIMAQVAADMLGLPIENISVKLGDSTLPQSPGRRRIVDRGLGVATRSSTTAARGPQGAAAAGQGDAELAARRRRAPDDVVLADGKIVSKRDAARAVSIADAMRHGKVERIEQEKTNNFDERRASTRATPIRRSSPR